MQASQDLLPCLADRVPCQGNQVEITDTRDVIPGGQGTGYQQIGHPAKVVKPFGKLTNGGRHVLHPASLRTGPGSGCGEDHGPVGGDGDGVLGVGGAAAVGGADGPAVLVEVDVVAAARPGGRLGDISAAIGKVGGDGGYGISTDLGGHGVGRTMHEDPHIPNRGRAGRGLRLVPGLVLAIEPWFIEGGKDGIWLDDDGWTIRTSDGSRAAHAEHTIAITDDGPVILTVP